MKRAVETSRTKPFGEYPVSLTGVIDLSWVLL